MDPQPNVISRLIYGNGIPKDSGRERAGSRDGCDISRDLPPHSGQEAGLSGRGAGEGAAE